MTAHGPVGKSIRAHAVSAVLRDVPGFGTVPTRHPKQLFKGFAALPGVTARTITDPDDDRNHGILRVQANGQPVDP